MKRGGLSRSAKKFLDTNLKIKKNELVSLFTDRKKCDLFDSILNEVEHKTNRIYKVNISNKRENSQPLPDLNDIFRESNVVIGITDKSITHCPELKRAIKNGTRAITMIGVDKKLFLKSIKADMNKIKKINNYLIKKLKNTKKVRVTTHTGTDIVFKVIKKNISHDDGDSTKKGSLNNFPYGEVFVAPIKKANGILVIDYSKINIKPGDKATFLIINGKIVDNSGGKAQKFVDYLENVDGDRALKVVELGFGTNPEHKKLIQNIMHDEKIYGSVHVAFGGYGEKRKSKIHEDVMLLNPTVWFDYKIIIKDGKILG
ncbi:MAG: aminopeptidase [Candidatus Nanoarchaeia archaeon]|nr:aminopeptidase [Candidatus Nanoarchaeia archaeon]